MRKVLIILILSVTVVMSVTLASWVVFTRFEPHREIVVMMRKMARLESFTYDAGISWSRREDAERANTTLYASGQVVSRQTGEVEQATKFRVVRLSGDRDYSDLVGEIRHVVSKTYLTYAPPGPDVRGVEFDNETWVGFEQGEIAAWGEVLPGLKAPIESMTPTGVWDTLAIQRLRTLLSVTDVFLIEYNGLTQIIDGKATRILDSRFDPEAIEAFLLDLTRAKYGEEPDEEQRILAHSQAANLARLTLRFWVGVNDHLLYRLQAVGGFRSEDGSDFLPMDARIEFSKFDEPVWILEPVALEFADIYRSMFGSLPSSGDVIVDALKTLVRQGTTRLPTTQIEFSDDPDGDGLDNVLETFYGTSSSIADTDGDGVNDGNEVRSSRNPRGDGSLFGFGLD